MPNVAPVREAVAQLEKLLALGDIVTPGAVRRAEDEAVRVFRDNFIGHGHLIGPRPAMPRGPDLVTFLRWMVERAERGEVEEPGAARHVR